MESDRRTAWMRSAATLGVRRALRRSGLGSRLAIIQGGALLEEGWFESFGQGRAVDRRRRPVPWYTYCGRHFLERRLSPAMRVFEYGTGQSSLWFAERVAEVVAVEHDPAWAAAIRADAPPNLTVLLAEEEDAYLDSIQAYPPFDIVAVDGLQRCRAATAAQQRLTPAGVLIWDNSDWPEFSECFPRLQEHGFKQLEFRGMGPISRARWETSILYRADNCLGI